MSELQAALLGVVQGLTEFLPVSSSGHLVIVQHLMGVRQEGLAFEVLVHVATLAAIGLFYRRRIASLVAGAVRGRAEAWRYGGKLALGTVPAVALVLAAGELLEAQFESAPMAGAGLLVTGALVWTTRTTAPRASDEEPGWLAALVIGCAQALAILPGISRSGATVSAALALGVAPAAAAEFSFLLGFVAISGAALRALPDLDAATQAAAVALGVGFATSFVAGIAALWLFVRLLRTRHFHRFAWYAWAAGAAFLAWLALGPRV